MRSPVNMSRTSSPGRLGKQPIDRPRLVATQHITAAGPGISCAQPRGVREGGGANPLCPNVKGKGAPDKRVRLMCPSRDACLIGTCAGSGSGAAGCCLGNAQPSTHRGRAIRQAIWSFIPIRFGMSARSRSPVCDKTPQP